MSLNLTGPSLHPAGARTLLIMMHGYGASGDDLFPLVRGWANDDLAVWAPNAPVLIGQGFCWFEFDNIKRKDIERPLALHQTTEPTYNALLSYVEQHKFDSVILGGFSQGAMLALHIMAMYQPSWPVLAYGGGFFTQNPPNLDGSRVCMIHGAEDDVVVPTYLTEGMLALARCGVSVEGHLRPYVGHNIDLVAAQIGKAFIQRELEKRKKQ